MSRKHTIILKVDRRDLPGSGEHGAVEETDECLESHTRDRSRPFSLQTSKGGLRIAAVCAVVAVAAALDSILTAFALALASV
jgi:hypothetical protein